MRDRRGLEENFPHKSGPLLWASPGAAKALHQQYPLRENIKRTEACARGCEYIYNEWRPGLGAWRATPLVNISCLRPQPLLLINLITLDPVIRTLCKIQTYLYWNAYAILYVRISELGNVYIQTPQTNKEKIYNSFTPIISLILKNIHSTYERSHNIRPHTIWFRHQTLRGFIP